MEGKRLNLMAGAQDGVNLALGTAKAATSTTSTEGNKLTSWWALSEFGQETLGGIGRTATVSCHARTSCEAGVGYGFQLRKTASGVGDMTSDGTRSDGNATRITTEWKRLVVRLTTAAAGSGTLWLHLSPTAEEETVEVCHLKLELGDEPTGWSPAPEDMAAAV